MKIANGLLTKLIMLYKRNKMDDLKSIENPSINVLPVILNIVTGFSTSKEYKKLDKEDKKLNYVIICTFNKYFGRLLSGNKNNKLNSNEMNDLELCYKFLDELANSENHFGPILLIEGIFDWFLYDNIKDIVNSNISDKTKQYFNYWRNNIVPLHTGQKFNVEKS